MLDRGHLLDPAHPNRRGLLKLVGTVALGSVLAACSSTPPPAPTMSAKPAPAPAANPTPVVAAAKPTQSVAQPTAAPSKQASPTAPAQAAPATGGSVKLTLTYWGGAAEGKYMQDIADRFQKSASASGISVALLGIPTSTYDTKLLTMIAGGQPPDVQMTLRFTYFNFVAKGIALKLTPYLQAANYDKSLYYDVGLSPYTFRGNLYGLPREVDVWIMDYNKDLLDAAGVPAPDGTWTWDELITYGKKLTKRDSAGRPLQFGFGYSGLGGAKAFDGFVYQAGGQLVDNEDTPTKFLLDQPNAANGVQFMADLASVHKIAPLPSDLSEIGSVNDLFQSGKIAMRYGEYSTSNVFQTITKFKWDIGEPFHGEQKSTWVGGACYTVNTKSPHPAEAVKFVVFAAGPEGSTAIAENRAGIPAVKSVATSSVFLGASPPPNNKAALAVFPYGNRPPMLPTFNEWSNLILNALDPVWVGKTKALDALKSIAPKAQALIDQGHQMLETIQ